MLHWCVMRFNSPQEYKRNSHLLTNVIQLLIFLVSREAQVQQTSGRTPSKTTNDTDESKNKDNDEKLDPTTLITELEYWRNMLMTTPLLRLRWNFAFYETYAKGEGNSLSFTVLDELLLKSSSNAISIPTSTKSTSQHHVSLIGTDLVHLLVDSLSFLGAKRVTAAWADEAICWAVGAKVELNFFVVSSRLIFPYRTTLAPLFRTKFIDKFSVESTCLALCFSMITSYRRWIKLRRSSSKR